MSTIESEGNNGRQIAVAITLINSLRDDFRDFKTMIQTYYIRIETFDELDHKVDKLIDDGKWVKRLLITTGLGLVATVIGTFLVQ